MEFSIAFLTSNGSVSDQQNQSKPSKNEGELFHV